MDAQESASATKPKLGERVTKVATLYNPRTWKEKGLWWTLGLFLVTYVVVVIVLGFIWSRSPGEFDVREYALETAKRFKFPLAFTPDIFHAALSKGVDILITDTNDPKIEGRIPAWFRKGVNAGTFVIFPLTIKNNPVAMIYADADRAGEIVIPEKELSLLRTLRNRAVLAIKQSS